MQLHKNGIKLSKHSTAVILSVVVVIVINIALFISLYLPAQQARDSVLAEEEQLVKEVDALQEQIASFESELHELNEALSPNFELESIENPWNIMTWKSEFGLYLAATESKHHVTFTDVVFTNIDIEDELKNEDSFSLIIEGSLMNIARTLNHLYDIPAMLEVLNWDLSAKHVDVTAIISDEELYVLRLQGAVMFVE